MGSRPFARREARWITALDGAAHAFLLDTKTRGTHQHRGIGTAGCEWPHVDFVPELGPFYFGACGFRPTEAGLIRLNDQGS
ncbi:hypothetical protein NQK81_28540 [Amycolatopsis roodepoortensis]|uniref:hypothetical protein n=1 Tax=Amycolatopsis roodepoortensis TaxID=700274 RepID=UPI00214D1024|nr:hypothetical protein [Amycolatopsis roodepoortensis]UUV28716.1 hypothetical protein NQK81_28540 [Amycolatopsis roodepoortensis]